MHCLNIVRCMIVYLDCINIMRFQKKKIIITLGPVYTMPVRRRFDLTPVWNLLFFDHPFTRVRYDAGIKGVKTQFGSHTGSISCRRGSGIV